MSTSSKPVDHEPKHRVFRKQVDGHEKIFVETSQVDKVSGTVTTSVSAPMTRPQVYIELAQNEQSIAQRLQEIELLKKRNAMLKKLVDEVPETTAADAVSNA